ncbi:MAG: 1-acyl-sn-glycerol-3-phosphate acyltransferase [Elusimicrobia bacterium]|nr:MAG: 1-acyl-sn-glycerol-3-phosphate acyltransferase [Elusimicrobiota bacterium]
MGMAATLEDVSEFQRGLRETGAYRSDPARPLPALDRALGRFDFWYYVRLLGVIWDANRLVKSGRFTPATWEAVNLSYLRLLEGVGARLEVSGLDYPAAAKRPVVFVGNHMSILESFLLPAVLLHLNRVAAVVKESLLNYPLLGPFARATEPVSVGRTNPRDDLRAVLCEGRRCLEEGRSVILFPQATRSAVFDPAAFNTLGVKLARDAAAPIVPLALKTDFQANGRFAKDVGPLDRTKTVHIRFGPPLAVGDDPKEANRTVVRFISAALAEWGAA